MKVNFLAGHRPGIALCFLNVSLENQAYSGEADGMKFGYELMLWMVGGVCLLWLFFDWPPFVQPMVQSIVSFLLHP